MELEIGAQLKTSLDDLNHNVRTMNQILKRQTDVPVDVFYRSQGVVAVSTGLTFPQPIANVELGRVFVGRRWVVAGNQWTDARAGGAVLLQSPTQPTLIDTNSVVAAMATIPGIVYFSSRQLVMRANDALWVVITGTLIPTAQYLSTIAGEDYSEGGYQATLEL